MEQEHYNSLAKDPDYVALTTTELLARDGRLRCVACRRRVVPVKRGRRDMVEVCPHCRGIQFEALEVPRAQQQEIARANQIHSGN